MTPKEKAEELVRKYSDSRLINIVHGLDHDDAIECAKLAVDEILDELNADPEDGYWVYRYEYFQEVKQELEKM